MKNARRAAAAAVIAAVAAGETVVAAVVAAIATGAKPHAHISQTTVRKDGGFLLDAL